MDELEDMVFEILTNTYNTAPAPDCIRMENVTKQHAGSTRASAESWGTHSCPSAHSSRYNIMQDNSKRAGQLRMGLSWTKMNCIYLARWVGSVGATGSRAGARRSGDHLGGSRAGAGLCSRRGPAGTYPRGHSERQRQQQQRREEEDGEGAVPQQGPQARRGHVLWGDTVRARAGAVPAAAAYKRQRVEFFL